MASMLSDDESFVILGSMPTPSINAYIERLDAAATTPVGTPRKAAANEPPSSQRSSLLNGGGGGTLSTDASVVHNLTEAMLEMPPATTSPSSPSSMTNGAAASVRSFRTSQLAHDAELVQSSIVDFFPSLCTSAAAPEDMHKLSSLVCEHLEMKGEFWLATVSSSSPPKNLLMYLQKIWRRPTSQCVSISQ